MNVNMKLEDLTMVIKAIKELRSTWLASLDRQAKEKLEDKPKMSYGEAFEEVLTTQESHEIFQRVLALYSCIGSDSEAYIQALETKTSNNVVEFSKKGKVA